MKVKFPLSGKELLILGIVSLILFLALGSIIGSIIGLAGLILKSVFRLLSGLVSFAFDSVFNFLLVGLAGFLGYRWYENRMNKEEGEVSEVETYDLEGEKYE